MGLPGPALRLRRGRRCTLRLLKRALISPPRQGSPTTADRAVLEAVLLRILDGPDVHWTLSSKGRTAIVLDANVPDTTAYLQDPQLEVDIGKRNQLPQAVRDDLMRRNGTAGTYDSLPATWSAFVFDPRVVLTDLARIWRGTRDLLAFEHAYPEARAWVSAWLPTYTSDGTHALLRAGIGPTPHGATIAVWLARSGETWVVEWIQVAAYA